MSSALLRRSGPNSASQGSGRRDEPRKASGTADQLSMEPYALIHQFRPLSADPSWVQRAKGLPRPSLVGANLVIMVPQARIRGNGYANPSVLSWERCGAPGSELP